MSRSADKQIISCLIQASSICEIISPPPTPPPPPPPCPPLSTVCNSGKLHTTFIFVNVHHVQCFIQSVSSFLTCLIQLQNAHYASTPAVTGGEEEGWSPAGRAMLLTMVPVSNSLVTCVPVPPTSSNSFSFLSLPTTYKAWLSGVVTTQLYEQPCQPPHSLLLIFVQFTKQRGGCQAAMLAAGAAAAARDGRVAEGSRRCRKKTHDSSSGLDQVLAETTKTCLAQLQPAEQPPQTARDLIKLIVMIKTVGS